MSIGKRLREFAESKYGSIKSLAEAIEVKPPNLQKYLRDEREPGTATLIKLKKVGCDINWLLFGESEMLTNNDQSNKEKPEKYPDVLMNRVFATNLQCIKLEAIMIELLKRVIALESDDKLDILNLRSKIKLVEDEINETFNYLKDEWMLGLGSPMPRGMSSLLKSEGIDPSHAKKDKNEND